MSDFIQRMSREISDLQGRADKLKAFIESEKFTAQSVDMQKLLLRQLGVMTEYLIVLGQRLQMVGGAS